MTEDDEAVDSLIVAVARIPERAVFGPGSTIGRYRLERRIGAGSMGVVWEAHDPDLDRRVAIKVMRSSSESLATRLRSEGQALARLSHPNVITVYDVGVSEGELYIVMQLVDGTSLDQWLPGRTPREIIEAVTRAGRGLEAAHDAGIVHRDVKPGNVLVGRDGSVRVSDFGLAQAAGVDAGGVAGTPAYMAPEQLDGERVTAAADQFALCMTLWEALYQERPARGDRRVPAAKRGVSRRVRYALARGLAVSPTDRFASIDELLAALAPRRRPTWPALAVIAIAAAAAAIVWRATAQDDPCATQVARIASYWNPTIEAGARQRLGGSPFAADDLSAFARFAQRWPGLRAEACHDDHRPQRAVCLDRALIGLEHAVAAAPWSTRKWGRARPDLPSLARCNETDPDRLPTILAVGPGRSVGVPGGSYGLSPDGLLIAMAENGSVRFIDTRTNDVSVVTLPPEVGQEELFGWYTERELWFLGEDQLHVVDASTGRLVATRALPRGAETVSPDGTQTVVDDGQHWFLISIPTGERTPLAISGRGGSLAWSPDGRHFATSAIEIHSTSYEVSLAVVDTHTHVVVEVPMRLDHDILNGIALTWLDKTRIVIAGRTGPNGGEGLWTASVAGTEVDWEHRLPAPTFVGYGPVAAAHGRLLALDETVRDEVTKIDRGIATALTTGLPVEDLFGISPDGRELAVMTSRGPGLVAVRNGTFRSLAMAANALALGSGGEVIAIDGATLSSYGVTGKRVIAKVPPDQLVRCSYDGGHCVVFARGDERGTVTVVTASGLGRTVPVAFTPIDVEVSPDGARVAISGMKHDVAIVELASGEATTWSVPVDGCSASAFPQNLAWSRARDRLIVSVWCDAGRSRLVEVGSDVPARTVFESDAWIGQLVVAPDGAIYARRRYYESQPVLIEGM